MKPSHPLSVVFLVTMVSFISSGLAMDDARQSVPEEGQKKELFTSSFDDHKDRMPSYQSTSRRSSPPYDMTTEKILSTSKKGDKLPSIGYSKKSSHTSASIELPRLDQEAFMERSRKSYLGSQRRPTEESKNIEESQKRERVRRIEKSQKIDESPKIQRSRGRNMDGLLNSSSIRTTKSNAPTTTTSRSFQKREDIHSYHGYKNETSSSPKFIGHSPPQFSKKMYNGSSSTESIEEKKTECTPNGTTSTSSSSSHEDTATQRQTKKSYHNDKESYSNFMLFKKKLHRKSNGISRSEGRNPQRSTRHVPDPNELLIDPLRVATAVGSLVLRGFPDLGLIYTGLLAADRAGYLDYGYEVGNKAIEMTVKAGEISLPYIKTVSTNVGSYLAEKSSELASSLYIKCTNYFQPVGDSDEWTVVGAPTNSELAEKAWNNSLKRVLVEELNFMEKFSSSFLSIAEQLQISEDFNIKKLYTFFFQNALSRIQNYIEEKMGPTMGLSYTCRDSVPYLTRSKKLDEIKYYWSADQDADFQDLVFSIPEILFVLLEVRGFYLHYFNVILSLPVVYNVPDDLFLIPLERYTAFCHDLSEHFFNTKGFELFNKIYNGTLTKWRSQFLILDNLHLAIEGTDVFKGSASTAVPFEGLDDSEAGQLYYRFRRHVNMKIVAFNSEENLDEQVKKGRLDSAEYGQYDIAFTFSYLIIMRAESVRVFSHADWKLLIVEEKILLRHRKDTVSVQIYCSNDLSSQRRKKFLNLFHIFFNESLYTNTQKIRYAYFHNDLDEFQLEDVDPIIEKLYPSVDQRPVYYSAQVYQSGNEVDIQLKHYGKSGLLDKSNQFQEPPSNGPVLPWSPISPGSIISKFSSDNVDRKPVEMANQGRLRKESSGSLSGKVVSSEEFESLLSSKSKDKYACPLKGASKEKFESFRRQPPSKNSRSSDQDNLPTTPAIYKSAIFEKSMKNLFENQLGEYIPKEYSRASRNGNASSTYSWNSEIKVILDSVSEQSIDEDSVQ